MESTYGVVFFNAFTKAKHKIEKVTLKIDNLYFFVSGIV